jgi:hypothetical protein
MTREEVPEDWMDEALANNRANGLPANPPTEMRRYVNGEVVSWSNTSAAMAKAWVDDMTQLLGQMCFTAEIDGWEQDNERRLDILHRYYPEEYERICEELWAARENVNQLRW